MFNLTRLPKGAWSIFDELESMHAGLNRLFEECEELQQRGTAFPALNVWSDNNGVVIDAELPGVDPKEVDVSVHGNKLTLRGKINQPETNDIVYLRRERPHGEFVRVLRLPFRADTGAVKANYKNGILRLTLPRCKDEQPQRIAVEAP